MNKTYVLGMVYVSWVCEDSLLGPEPHFKNLFWRIG